MEYKKDLSGKRFGRLTVLGFSHKEVKKHRSSEYKPFQKRNMWKCKCACGNTVLVSTSNLTSGNTKSCGCLKKELREFRKVDKFVFPVLDTSGIARSEEIWKLKEEFQEFKAAIDEYDNCQYFGNKEQRDNVLEEFYDLIQVSVNLLDMLDISSIEKQEGYKKHIEKMVERGWSTKTYV